MAVRKVGLHYEAEKLLFGLHLEYGSIVVAEMIVGALPEVGLRLGDHLYGITFDDATLWFPGPAEFAQVQLQWILVLCHSCLAFAIVFAVTCCE